MRIAIVSDIHGNRTAFEAVLVDLRDASPDLILHGGDLADNGSSPVEIIDQIRDLGWQGVIGNTDEMLISPTTLTEFASQSPQLKTLFATIEEMAAHTRAALGDDRLHWLRGLPRIQIRGPLALVHASPASPWRAPAHTADADELESRLCTARPTCDRIRPHSSFLRQENRQQNRRQLRQRQSLVRWRPARFLPLTGRIHSDHPPRRVQRGQRTRALSQCGLPHAHWIGKIPPRQPRCPKRDALTLFRSPLAQTDLRNHQLPHKMVPNFISPSRHRRLREHCRSH